MPQGVLQSCQVGQSLVPVILCSLFRWSMLTGMPRLNCEAWAEWLAGTPSPFTDDRRTTSVGCVVGWVDLMLVGR